MAPFGRATYAILSVCQCSHCTILEISDEFRNYEILVKGHSPCEFVHGLYTAESWRPGAIFIPANSRPIGLSTFTSTA